MVKILAVPPYWQIEPSDNAVLLNGSLTVSCEARGHPPPAIYWTKYSGKIIYTVYKIKRPSVIFQIRITVALLVFR